MHDTIVADGPWSDNNGKSEDSHNAAEQPPAAGASNFQKSCRKEKGKQRENRGIGKCRYSVENAEAEPYREMFLQMKSLGETKAGCEEERGQRVIPDLSSGEVDCKRIDCPEPPGQLRRSL